LKSFVFLLFVLFFLVFDLSINEKSIHKVKKPTTTKILGEYRRCKSPSFYESKVTLMR